LLAKQLGSDELSIVKALAADAGTAIRCSDMTPREFALAIEAGIPLGAIVLSISALVTVSLADAWKHLPPNRCFLVSRSTKDRIEEWVTRADESRSHEGGYASVSEEGRLYFEETTSEQRDAQREELQSIKRMIESHCTVKSSEGVASIAPEKRNAFVEVAGFHNLESIALTMDVNGTLWSDDAVLSFIAKADYGISSVCTQTVMGMLMCSKEIATDEFDLITAKLASWNYVSTVWKAATIIRAGRHASWDHQKWPFKQCIALIGKSAVNVREKAQIALEALKLLRQSDCGPIRQSPIIQAILNSVGSPQAVMGIYGRLRREYAVDYPSLDFFEPEFEYWLKSHVRR
jgi:hypothetical protein